MTSEPASYVGRFAPSPTGPLHFGSLLTAVASFAQALVHRGEWLIRIEDIDPPREQHGSDKLILDMLEAYGFEWNRPVSYQSTFAPRHDELVACLLDQGLAYKCTCSRRDLADATRGLLGAIYPGTCRNGCGSGAAAVRIIVDDRPVEFEDALQGPYGHQLQSVSGDFVIKRRDGLIAYHLAVVIDDFDQGITEIVRGIDLMDSTPRQIYLQRQLGFTTPAYMHVPIAVNGDRQKLSKSTGARPISAENAGKELCMALHCLDQNVAAGLADEGVSTIWQWVSENWSARELRFKKEIPATLHGYG